MIIGKFTQQEQGYIGWIDTAGLRVADVTFSPMPLKQGSGPDFIVLGMAIPSSSRSVPHGQRPARRASPICRSSSTARRSMLRSTAP